MNYLTLSKKNDVAVIHFNHPGEKVNTLDEALMDEFSTLMDELETDQKLAGVVLISAKKDSFIAGADIDMIKKQPSAEALEKLSRAGQQLLNRVEAFHKPVVAAIHGSCLGGGLELALACHYRVCSNHAKTAFALPEVNLGLIPGTGGTQRLPRVIGIQKALTYMLTGKKTYAHQAKKIGLADELTHKDALETAGIAAVHTLRSGKFRRKKRGSFAEKLLESNALGRRIIFAQAKKKTIRKTRGNYPAPLRIIDATEFGYTQGIEAGLKNEARLFGEMGTTQQSKHLVNLFFGMNAAKKLPDTYKTKPIHKIAVLGAGLMGSGIAEVSVDKGGYRVLLKDQTLQAAAKGEKAIWAALNKKAEKKIITRFERDEISSRVTGVDSYEYFEDVDLVIEAVFEDLALKQRVVAEIEAQTHEQCIFASNTSALPISKIAEKARRPENIIGMHYFSPVQKMPLLELIVTDKTSDWAIQTARRVGVKQGKHIIVVKDGPGFYTTRILAPYMNEALLLLEEGASIEFLDNAMRDFGFPVGPMALFDEVGIDVAAHVADTLAPVFAKRGVQATSKSEDLLKAEYKGRKNKRGFYLYSPNKRKEINTGIYSFFGGMKRANPEVVTAQHRMALAMINEAAWCLQEGILQSPEDGDLGAILGLGFPPFLGGPFRYTDQLGIKAVVDKLNRFTDEFGLRFKPADILEDYAKNRKSFHP